MIIHLTGSSRHLDEDLPILQKIAQLVEQNDCKLANNWLTEAQSRVNDPTATDWQAIMAGVLEDVSRADIIIVEGTHYSFMQGYQTAIALMQKKPVLLLSRNPFTSRSVVGLKNRLLTLETYQSTEDLQKIVSNFIRANTISTKDLRFNMFIDRPIYNHLRNLAYETGKNRSEIIRDLIYRDMHKED